MDISYKGIWGYAPLVNTKEVLPPGQRTEPTDAAQWIDRAMNLCLPRTSL